MKKATVIITTLIFIFCANISLFGQNIRRFYYNCETEGFVRFRLGHQVGMLDRNDNVVIPAEFDVLTNVKNGMIVAINDAVCRQTGVRLVIDYSEPFRWHQGQILLLDTLGNVLVNDFSPYNNNLDFFSLKITETPHPDTIRDNFLATDGSYFSFVNFEREFEQWLFDDLLVNLTMERKIEATLDSVATWIPGREFARYNNIEFANSGYFEILKRASQNPNLKPIIRVCRYCLHPSGRTLALERYYACGGIRISTYPRIRLFFFSLYYGIDEQIYLFLRTESGYKLYWFTSWNV